ncbi:insulin-induced gene 1 protein-like [Sycon ciliatum]|uniref:insulin-induced gene 1 protein-like n=1 Tax=Sycon ciliatum TaxID=27933 RepID=UPI0020AAA7F3|eukprot:scpid50205/ scgid8155/ Insulin-induced gene 2 protein
MSRTPLMEAFRLAFRVGVLFSVGILCSMVLNPLQIQHRVTTLSMFTWWVAPCCGAAAVFIGLVYPCVDDCVGHGDSAILTDWTSVMRCLVVFLGINQASVSIPYSDDQHLALSLAAMSLGMWFLFDRTAYGFGLGISVAALATFVAQIFVFSDFYTYTHPDFLFVRSWLPAIFFCGGVTFGHLGRKLADVDLVPLNMHEKVE